MKSELRSPPFFRILPAFLAGIVIAEWISFPVLYCWIAVVILLLLAVAVHRTAFADIYLYVAIAATAFALSIQNKPVRMIVTGDWIHIETTISENLVRRGRWDYAEGTSVVFKTTKDQAGWNATDEKIRVAIDTAYGLLRGERISVRGYLNGFDRATGYGRLMHRRGYAGQIYVTQGNLTDRKPGRVNFIMGLSAKMQSGAAGRLARLTLDEDDSAIVAAMTVGDKSLVSRDLRARYNSSGAAHLLAISGLHVGIVFLLINFILYLLPVFRHGNVIKSAVAVVLIWLFALTAGMTPSVTRAALMFSFAQLAVAASSYRDGLNIMMASAVIMLAVNPSLAADPGFLLSYSAVGAILLFFGPVFELFRTRWKIVNGLLGLVLVGFIASVGTAPLVSYFFGSVPVTNLLINPVVVLAANVTVMGAAIWIVIPFGFLEPLFSAVIGFSAGIQNRLVEWSAGPGLVKLEGTLPLWGVLLAYAIIIVLAALLRKPRAKAGEN